MRCHRPRERRRARRCEACRRRRLLRELPLQYRKRRGRPLVDRLTPDQKRRRMAGLCIDCGSSERRGRSWRCERCKRRAQLEAVRRYNSQHRLERLARAKARYRNDPDLRQRRNEYKREWRRKNRLKVLLQKRRARLAGKPNGYSSRDKYEAYQRAYRARHAERRRALARARYYAQHPVRPEPRCRVCSASLAYEGQGRPPAYCTTHKPWRRRTRDCGEPEQISIRGAAR